MHAKLLSNLLALILLILPGLVPAREMAAPAPLPLGARTIYRPGSPRAALLAGERGRPLPNPARREADPAARALGFLGRYGAAFGLRDARRELVLERVRLARDGRTIVRFQQVAGGVPVLGGELIVALDAGGDVLAVTGEVAQGAGAAAEAFIPPAAARQAALEWLASATGLPPAALTVGTPEAWIYAPALLGGPEDGPARRVWSVVAGTADPLGAVRERVLVDARDGRGVANFDLAPGALYRRIYDAANDPVALPGVKPARVEGGYESFISDVNWAYDYGGEAYAYFYDHFGRDGIDGQGMDVVATVRYPTSDFGPTYERSYWNGSQMVFDADMAQADDVVAHEYTHGVIQYEANLFNYYQSGAIAESMADVFGELVDQANDATPGSDQWWIGEDLPGGQEIWNMIDPESYKSPGCMTSPLYSLNPEDHGGVHKNRGVGDRAAYLMAEGESRDGYPLYPGIGVEKTGWVWYTALTELLTSGADYFDLYVALNQACLSRVGSAGITAADCEIVQQATLSVEMDQPARGQVEDAPLCPVGAAAEVFAGEDFEGSAAGWSQTPPEGWGIFQDGVNAHAGQGYLHAGGGEIPGGEAVAEWRPELRLPPGAVLHFHQAYDFGASACASGRLEYSLDGGATWGDAGLWMDAGGYNGAAGAGCAEAGTPAFSGTSRGYVTTRLNLAALAGAQPRFRWRLVASGVVGGTGWYVDDVTLAACDTHRVYLPFVRR